MDYMDLVKKKMKMDRFFTKFLEMFDNEMKEHSNSPVWNLYNKKYDEYVKLTNKIKIIEYKLKRQ
jgi:hypothetical protein